MDELNHFLHQLPNFLQSEITSQAGNLSGSDQIGIVDRYWTAANQLIASKRAPLRQEHIDNARYLWNGTQSTKVDMENRQLLRDMPGPVGTDFYTMTITTDFYLQSIRFLTEFRVSLEALSARLKEQQRLHAQHQAQEAARRLAEAAALAQAQAAETARRQAEAAAHARMLAEETARRVAEEQAAQERAKEAALQLAERQVKEAAQALAQRQAENTPISKESEVTRPVDFIAGPEIKAAIGKLKLTIEQAVADLSDVINRYDPSGDQFARLHAIDSLR
jgi:pyruvate/2-oxoglutarate dehydrogenase complex dihydrolipoamide acyltransferase (E2) component